MNADETVALNRAASNTPAALRMSSLASVDMVTAICVAPSATVTDAPDQRRAERRFHDQAFPRNEHAPSEFRQRGSIPRVALHRASNFRAPKLLAGFRPNRICATVMVPEAPMNEHNGAMFRKYDVGPAGQIAPVQPESKSCSMERPPDG
jgi:hypothetical protein